MSKNTEYQPKFAQRAQTRTRCNGACTIQIQRGTSVSTETCPKCNGAGYIMIQKELR